jgi:hypothetical protein
VIRKRRLTREELILKARLVIATACLLAALLPANGWAGTLSREGSAVVFQAGPGETNALTIIYSDLLLGGSKEIAVGDYSLGVQAGPGCQHAPAAWVACSSDGVVEVRVYSADSADTVNVNSTPVPIFIDAGEGDDYVPGAGYDSQSVLRPVTAQGGPGNDRLEGSPWTSTNFSGGEGNDILAGSLITGVGAAALLDGGPGDDQISGGRGKDTVRGGDGVDRIYTKDDRQSDEVSCGPGNDPTVIADSIDRVAADCEDPVETTLAIVPCAKRLVYTRKGRFRLCVEKASEVVSGTITVKTLPSVSSGKPPRKLASRRFSARRGRRTAVRFRLTSRARRLIAHQTSVRVVFFARVRDAQNHPAKFAAVARLNRPPRH